MNFANINTGEIKEVLSPILQLAGVTITGATIQHYAQLGWRQVVEVDAPAVGFRVTSYGVQELTGLTCKLTVATSIDIAAETAANAAAYIAATKSDAKALLDGSTDTVQRTLRAFAEVTLQEINNLRTKTGLATYTWSQFLTALKNKIDSQA
jgi:uncharacterized protein YkwD